MLRQACCAVLLKATALDTQSLAAVLQCAAIEGNILCYAMHTAPGGNLCITLLDSDVLKCSWR